MFYYRGAEEFLIYISAAIYTFISLLLQQEAECSGEYTFRLCKWICLKGCESLGITQFDLELHRLHFIDQSFSFIRKSANISCL